MRLYWENFIKGTDVLVFVVDAVDEARLPEAKEELHKLLADERLKSVPLVLIANKQVKCLLLGGFKTECTFGFWPRVCGPVYKFEPCEL